MKRLRKSSGESDPSIEFRLRKISSEPKIIIDKPDKPESYKTLKSICETLSIDSVQYWKLNENTHSYSKQHVIETIDKIHSKLQLIFNIEASTDDSLMQHLVKRFTQAKNHKEKLETTILVPKNITRDQVIQRLPGCTKNMVDSARKMLKEQKYYAEYEPVESKSIDKINVEKKINKFYYRDDISRAFPGMKDTKSVKQKDGTRVHIAKRYWLVIRNTKGFLSEYP